MLNESHGGAFCQCSTLTLSTESSLRLLMRSSKLQAPLTSDRTEISMSRVPVAFRCPMVLPKPNVPEVGPVISTCAVCALPADIP